MCLSFLWQDDEVVLQCVATIQKEHRKFCLAAEGLGNRVCYLESTSDAKVRVANSFVWHCRYDEETAKQCQFGIKTDSQAYQHSILMKFKLKQHSGDVCS